MKYSEMIEKIKYLDEKYNCLENDVNLLIELYDGSIVIGRLTDIDCWIDDKGNYGLDLISSVEGENE